MDAFPSELDLLACAEEAARAAGSHALNNIARRDQIVERHAHDVKLQLDLECQRRAEEVIRAHFPDHMILGEEGGRYVEGAAPLWIVDPIDGTVNFLHGLPLWCSSVAVRRGAEIVAGAVYAPALKECYTATAGGHALRNGEPIRVSDTSRLDDALVLTGMTKNIHANLPSFEVFREVSLCSRKTRIMGAAAVDICHVACGRADAYYESGIYLWDVAAAGLVARQAGATVEILEKLTEVRYRYLCTNGLVHEELKRIVRGPQ